MSDATCATESRSVVQDILAHHVRDRESLIPVLQEVQERLGYLSRDALDHLSEGTGISANEIYGVATFYSQFRFRPPAEHTICACLGTACHVRGGHQVLREFEQGLGIKAGETTSDGKFDLTRVACIGCCALAPVAVIDGKVNANMTPAKAKSLLAKYSDMGGEARA